MSLPYNRNNRQGRQSEEFLNDELHRLFEALKYINYKIDENKGVEPSAKLDASLWFNKLKKELKYFDKQTNTWKNVFENKFKITDHLLDELTPSDPIPSQLWIYNGVLMYFDGSAWQPIKALIQDDTQWSNAAFEDFALVTPLDPVGNQIVNPETNSDYYKYHYKNKIDYENEDERIYSDEKWTPEWKNPTPEEPAFPTLIDPEQKSQFIIPNINTDRLFVQNDYNCKYEEVSKICVNYPTVDIVDKTVSAIHLNPGKITNIIKRLVKVNKTNSTIDVPAYNTEFYGFRAGEYLGNFLIESKNQDAGDYIPVGNHIVLNNNATQNYDYVLAITYEFTWVKSSGKMDRIDNRSPKTSFYLTNLREPVNVHVDGLKLEEAAYDIDMQSGTVTINENADNTTITMWSPYKKQFGYIRETDLENRGIIKLNRKVEKPLVFVAGQLIHPLYGGLEFNNDKIYIPNASKNMPWCVVDLNVDIKNDMYSEYGTVEKSEAYFVVGEDSILDEENNLFLNGDLSEESNKNNVYDFILASGKVGGVNGNVIRYDTNKIKPNDGIILFVSGLLIKDEDILRDPAEGVVTLINNLEIGQEYVLLQDKDKRLYNESSMLPAISIGYLDESIVYMNGKLLCNTNCVTTTDPESKLTPENLTNGEIKYFITNEENGTGSWKKYNMYIYSWEEMSTKEINDIELIVSSYTNQLSAVKINIDHNKYEDEIIIYAFNYANTISGLTKIGKATFYEIDEDDGLQIFLTAPDMYLYGQGTLNIFKNGLKLINNVNYKEIVDGDRIKMLDTIDVNDVITYIIEPLESGSEIGHASILLTNKNALQPNIYRIDKDSDQSLYPGRLSVYVNGQRIAKTDWTILDNKTLMLKYNDFIAIGSSDNYPVEKCQKEDSNNIFEITHKNPDYILAEVRSDYDRKEITIDFSEDINNEIYIDKYKIPIDILEAADEIIIYWNGIFTGLSRNKKSDYRLDKYKGCVILQNIDFLAAMSKDPLGAILKSSVAKYAAWKNMKNKSEYIRPNDRSLTLVWR